MHQVVAFIGLKSAGKNTAAQALIDHYDFVPMSFAAAVKDAVATIFCWPRDLLEGITADSRAWREQIDPWWADKLGIADFTPRWALMNFGTEVMRQHFHPDIWILNVERRIIDLQADVVITDCRFPNEIKMIRERNGRMARIRRGADPDWTRYAHAPAKLRALGIHESEWAWLAHVDDLATINNDDDIDALHRAVTRWYQSSP